MNKQGNKNGYADMLRYKEIAIKQLEKDFDTCYASTVEDKERFEDSYFVYQKKLATVQDEVREKDQVIKKLEEQAQVQKAENDNLQTETASFNNKHKEIMAVLDATTSSLNLLNIHKEKFDVKETK